MGTAAAPGLRRAAPVAVVFVAALAACRAPPTKPPVHAAEIRRTAYGIPHVKANDEAGLGYGLGYAYAQDNYCVLAEEIVTVNGERSRHFGPDAVDGPDVASLSVQSTNRNSDLYYKWLNAGPRVAAAWRAQPRSLQALLEGYAAGVNRRLAETGRDALPAACRGAPWVRPLTALDLIRLTRRYTAEFSSLKFIDDLVAAKPPVAGDRAGSAPAHGAQAAPRAQPPAVASNAIALGRDATRNGRGLLLGQPHFPWQGILRLYQFHATIPGRLDVMGAGLPGLPVVGIGFTQHLAWTHTVNTSAHYTLYELQLDPRDPTRYRVGERWHAMTRSAVAIEVRSGGGRVALESHDFWMSIYGPVIARAGEFPWSAHTAYALRDANEANDRVLQSWYAMSTAPSLAAFERRVKALVGLPWVNTLAVDRDGEALYLDVTVVPNVTPLQTTRCLAPRHRARAAQGLFVLDGSRPECAWSQDPAAPQPGIVAGSRLPALRRTDFVQNANDSAWMTNPASPLVGFAPIVSRDGTELSGRTRLGLELIGAQLAGTAGRPGARFTMQDLQRFAYDNRVYAASLVLRDLNAVCDADAAPVTVDGAAVALQSACATLGRWDGTADVDVVGYPLFAAWFARVEAQPDIWAVPFSAADPVRTPRGLRRDDARIVALVREALARAILELRERGIDWTRPWGEIQYLEAGGRRYPIPGGAMGDIYNSMYSVPSAADDPGRMLVKFGTSYLQTVGFDERGPVAEAVLAYSQSSDPASPHAHDQLGVFSAGRWIRLPFTEAEIMADPAFRTVSIAE